MTDLKRLAEALGIHYQEAFDLKTPWPMPSITKYGNLWTSINESIPLSDTSGRLLKWLLCESGKWKLRWQLMKTGSGWIIIDIMDILGRGPDPTRAVLAAIMGGE